MLLRRLLRNLEGRSGGNLDDLVQTGIHYLHAVDEPQILPYQFYTLGLVLLFPKLDLLTEGYIVYLSVKNAADFTLSVRIISHEVCATYPLVVEIHGHVLG